MDIKSLRKDYLQHRKKLEELYLERPEPRDFLKQHTLLLDELIRKVFNFHLSHTSINDIALVATGGYGRGEMHPHSDVDLLFIHDFSDPDQVHGLISPLVTSLWDLIEDLGHQVWSITEIKNLDIQEHYEFVLALRDGRHLAGNQRLSDAALGEILPRLFQDNQETFIRIIHSEVSKRYERQKYTIFQLEPDIKESPGGLRDHLAAGWLQDLAGRPSYLAYTDQELSSAHEFMLGLRILLHILAGRNDNKMNISRQEKISFMLAPGSGDPKSQEDIRKAIETFMKRYYTNARILNERCRTMLEMTLPGPGKEELDLLEVSSPITATAIVNLFIRAGKENKKISHRLKNLIVAKLPAIKEGLDISSLREPLLEFFQPYRGMSSLLWEMYDLGFLEILLPEFSEIKARFCWDYYHRYTVDEHTLLAIRNIERLTPPEMSKSEEKPSDNRFASLLEETSDPVYINLALLFHDIGKGADGDHSLNGAGIAETAMRRLGFHPKEIDQVSFLVRYHLAMSTVVFHRDHNDKKVINEFADLVSDPETLRQLTLLTYADVKAVGPGTLNNWKKDQLWDVYIKVYRQLTLGYGAERIDEDDLDFDQKLLKNLPTELDRTGFETFLEGFPVSYLRTNPEKIYEHFQLASRLERDHPVQSKISKSNGLFELCVITPDKLRLFARIAGMLSYFDMNIIKGYGFSNNQDIVLDFFEFFDSDRRFRYQREIDRFQTMLHKVLAGDLSIRELLKQKTASPLITKMGKLKPVVYFEDDPERKVTLMEIISPDKPGLLYSIGSILSAASCDIELLLINTEGEKAVDVFYLRNNNEMLTDEIKQMLRRDILAAL